MVVQENFSLKDYNTFGIDAKARFFVEIESINDLQEILSKDQYPRKILLGGGSNMLLTDDINALVIHVDLKGKQTISETSETIHLKVMAGENWHKVVLWTLEHGYGGLENMSLIPGNTGTAPVQNIGAYGVELKDVFHSCEAIRIADQELVSFTKEECKFGYRDSYFKNEGKEKYVITSVTFTLSKINHKLNTGYGAIEEELRKDAIANPSIKDISNAVIAIRKSKLPDPKELGNSGSFFKNPLVSKEFFESFSADNPNAPFYKVSDSIYKIPAGWLIEQCGFKGKRFGDAGVHSKQALVLVNYGNATGQDILNLSSRIIDEVQSKFNITISPEVNIIKNNPYN
ncbi:UDP-N-acetylmuramate dehydrogenase [Maribacter sp. X9]|uniref:UDP-N-acetylmuramate dehydrogenase n=1 Tax=Maribacter sp. X9 TaxID=3402159 RepID=UPI003AF379AA